MIRGKVRTLQARLEIPMVLGRNRIVSLEFVIDTGFEGALTLPQEAVTTLGLPFFQEIDANLADDTDVRANVHLGTILWNAREIPVAVLAMGRRPLIGTALLQDLRLIADFVEDGEVFVTDRR